MQCGQPNKCLAFADGMIHLLNCGYIGDGQTKWFMAWSLPIGTRTLCLGCKLRHTHQQKCNKPKAIQPSNATFTVCAVPIAGELDNMFCNMCVYI